MGFAVIDLRPALLRQKMRPTCERNRGFPFPPAASPSHQCPSVQPAQNRALAEGSCSGTEPSVLPRPTLTTGSPPCTARSMMPRVRDVPAAGGKTLDDE